ncbi:MAG: tetratricopeptide repeat protein [Mariprofundaceae bacterium]|nr:tetratricopeptide repeat protein [Mariprofundaceae bacterium]
MNAAESGDPVAQFNLSNMYAFGWGVSKNAAEAMKWLRASADQRYPPAQYALSSHYASGAGVPKDSRKARVLLTDAAGQGALLAQMMLGRMHEAGYTDLEIKKDMNKAIAWYQRAAAQCGPCNWEMWRIHYFGKGVEKDPVRAAPYLQKAAEGGLPKAQMQLAFRYHDGNGLPKDDVRAYMWMLIARNGGDPTARKALPLLARKMSFKDVVQAKKMARENMERLIIRPGILCELYDQFCDR